MHAVTHHDTLRHAATLSVYLSPTQLALDLGVSRSLVYRWVRLGLPTTRIENGRIRISVDECAAWLAANTSSSTDGDAA
jgi:predicted site-specific integrase-resolvase